MNCEDIGQGCLAVFAIIVVIGLVIAITVIVFLILWLIIKSLLVAVGRENP